MTETAAGVGEMRAPCVCRAHIPCQALDPDRAQWSALMGPQNAVPWGPLECAVAVLEKQGARDICAIGAQSLVPERSISNLPTKIGKLEVTPPPTPGYSSRVGSNQEGMFAWRALGALPFY